MSTKGKPDTRKLDRVVAKARQDREKREQGYRHQALKLFPWICARCGREFNRHNLSELTVHHKDHNHDNNPRDGSNWELLCIYCHDNEHGRIGNDEDDNYWGDNHSERATSQPFKNLKDLLNQKDK